jgi:transcriptional regulator of acetoin/glycerol metabolism
VLQEDDLPPEINPPLELDSGSSGVDEKTRFLEALERARGNRALAARLLGISRATFYRRLADLNIPLAGK